eukprot:scaffold1941_cov377-Prasinococcus_capsulatus_cf.AAC.1
MMSAKRLCRSGRGTILKSFSPAQTSATGPSSSSRPAKPRALQASGACIPAPALLYVGVGRQAPFPGGEVLKRGEVVQRRCAPPASFGGRSRGCAAGAYMHVVGHRRVLHVRVGSISADAWDGHANPKSTQHPCTP